MASSFAQYFQDAVNPCGKVGYLWAHYDVSGFCSTTVKGSLENMAAILRSELVKAINGQVLLPKAIIVVFDDNLMDDINFYKPGFSVVIGRIVEWLFNQYHRIIPAHKEILPSKSRKFKFPTVLWVCIPLHNIYGHYNDFKQKFNRALSTTASLFCKMDTLSLDRDWDESNLSYFAEGCINALGLTMYWSTVDHAFEEWDREQMQLKFNSMIVVPNAHSHSAVAIADHKAGFECRKSYHHQHSKNTDKFHWKPNQTRFTLPKIRNCKPSGRMERHNRY